MTTQSFYTRFQKALYAIKLLHCYCEKELDNDKPRLSSLIHFQKSTSRIMCATVSKILMTKPLKTSRTSSRVITMLTLPKRLIIQTIVAMTKDQSPIVFGTIPLLLRMKITTHPHTAAVIILTNALAQIDLMMPACQAFVTNADSAKTAPLNGLFVQCSILPQVHKWLKILTPCTNLPNLASLLTPLHLQTGLLHHHAMTATLIPLTTQMTSVALPSTVALKLLPQL